MLIASMLLLGSAPAVAIIGATMARRQLHRVVASYTALVAAKDEQIEAYGRLIAEQEGCIAAQARLIRAHETRAAVLGLLPGRLDTSGAPLQ